MDEKGLPEKNKTRLNLNGKKNLVEKRMLMRFND